LLVGHENEIDDVNDAVGLEDVAVVTVAMPLFASVSMNLATGHRCREVFALDGFESGFAAALLDHLPIGEVMAFSTMVLLEYMAAPPTSGSFRA
jgi:hypothetical protein